MPITEKAVVLAVAPSKTNPNKTYEIRRGADGVVYCTCPAWRFQRLRKGETRTCKHLAAFFAKQLREAEPTLPKSEAASGLRNHTARKVLAKERDQAFRAAKKASAA